VNDACHARGIGRENATPAKKNQNRQQNQYRWEDQILGGTPAGILVIHAALSLRRASPRQSLAQVLEFNECL
jgi:hypothetical protein